MTARNTKKGSEIPQGVIARLPLYHRHLSELADRDVQRVSSAQLGQEIGLTAAQIRSDFSYFGSFGQQGYGYRVKELLQQISIILGLEKDYRLILIGAGNLGKAIASYANFRKRGFIIEAIFDANPLLEGNYLAACLIQPVDKLEAYLDSHAVDIAIITAPSEATPKICRCLVHHGVRGIWNFSPVHLDVPDHVVLEHTHLTDSLLRLSFRLNQQRSDS